MLLHDIGIFLEWWNDDMSTEQMRSIAKYFEQILDTLTSAQDATMGGAVGHISEQDWARLCALNASPPRRLDQCVHEVIEGQVALRPGKEAVCAWDGDLTYRALDDLATRVAFLLQAQGVGPEVRVGLCFDKSVRFLFFFSPRSLLLFDVQLPSFSWNFHSFDLSHMAHDSHLQTTNKPKSMTSCPIY